VAVLRRGPSDWSHVGRWDVARGTYEPGAWIRANLYPQRCDLSPDGRWLCYFTLKGGARWDVGDTYVAISRLPWLTALAAWSTCGSWTSGARCACRSGRSPSRRIKPSWCCTMRSTAEPSDRSAWPKRMQRASKNLA